MTTYEFGFSRVLDTVDKVKAIAKDGDKMSALGWELKAIYDNMTEIVLFYQREAVTTPSAPTTPTTPAPAPTTPTVSPTASLVRFAPVTTHQPLQAVLPPSPSVVVLRR